MKHHLALIITTILWGSAYIVSKTLLGSIDAYTLVFFRFLIATLVVATYAVVFKHSLWQSWRQGLVLGLFSFLSYFFIVYGMNYTSASVSGFLTALFVIFVPVFSWIWYRKQLSFMQWGAVALGMLGLVLVTGGVSAIGKGELFVIVGAMTVAIYILLADAYMKDAEHNLVALTFQQMLFNTLGGLILGLIFQSSFIVPTSTVWLLLLYLGIFPSILTNVLQLYAQKALSPSTVSLTMTLEPIFAALFAWGFGGEVLGRNILFGGLCVIGAMIINAALVRPKYSQP